MKTIKLSQNYPQRELSYLDKQGKKNNIEPETLTATIIVVCVNKAFEGVGMDLEKSRMWSKITDKIYDENGKPVKDKEIELSDEQFNFLYKAMSEAVIEPTYATVRSVFMDYLDTIKVAKTEEGKK